MIGCRIHPETCVPVRRVSRLAEPGVGLYSNAGISLFSLICCTQIPEFEVIDVL